MNLTCRRRTQARRAAGSPRTRRCGPGQAAELAVEMGLVVVAAVGGDLGEAAAVVVAEAIDSSLEADQRGNRLGRQPDLLAKPRRQVAVTAAQLGCQCTDLEAPTGVAQPPARPGDVRRRRPRRLDPPPDIGIEQLKSGVPVRRVDQPLGELRRLWPEHVVEWHHQVGRDLVHRDPEQHVRAERGQVDLHALEGTVFRGDGVGRVQSGDERMLDRLRVAGARHA